jgi:anti-sigma B factor antagonist
MEELDVNGTNLIVERSSEPGGAPVITLTGELDISSADTFRSVVDDAVRERPSRLVFELGGLTFMDSSGIAVMVHAANNAGEIELRHASTIVRRVVEATGLSDVLRLDPL